MTGYFASPDGHRNADEYSASIRETDYSCRKKFNMSDLKGKAKGNIDATAEAAKKAAAKVVDKSKYVAHAAGEKLEQGAKKLKGN